MLNIPSTINDPKYRYRMPKMQVKIESKGNGIKTNIVNLGDVAKHLRTNEQYILKFFGFEKASQTTFKEAGGKNNTNYIINGDFSEEDLRKVLDKFIEKYVCCPKCKLPEMHLQVQGEKINGKCDSCPFVGELDSKHKLVTFIIKNPPVAKNMATGKVVKVEADKAPVAPTYNTVGKKEEKKEAVVETVVSFNTDIMDFGSEELENFVVYIRNEIETLKDEDFDIKSAKIVSKVKPLGLKKPLIAYTLFKAFYTVNINQQIAETSKLYLNLMKKYNFSHLGSSSLILNWKRCSIWSICSWRQTRIRISLNFCRLFSTTSSRRVC
jgi:translation initiation factor 5